MYVSEKNKALINMHVSAADLLLCFHMHIKSFYTARLFYPNVGLSGIQLSKFL